MKNGPYTARPHWFLSTSPLWSPETKPKQSSPHLKADSAKMYFPLCNNDKAHPSRCLSTNHHLHPQTTFEYSQTRVRPLYNSSGSSKPRYPAFHHNKPFHGYTPDKPDSLLSHESHSAVVC